MHIDHALQWCAIKPCTPIILRIPLSCAFRVWTFFKEADLPITLKPRLATRFGRNVAFRQGVTCCRFVFYLCAVKRNPNRSACGKNTATTS